MLTRILGRKCRSNLPLSVGNLFHPDSIEVSLLFISCLPRSCLAVPKWFTLVLPTWSCSQGVFMIIIHQKASALELS
ncbi:unnamed protein product [Protopolystoma xenopodis]|uniref:Uncharacterized protein n=1 Tax=Protopolystoma xenopodis TaxID=117903 RepID=A0A3S5B9E5_9PLAT|nr:unnamed protein product [Protopolystoma xenopodis]